MTVVGDRRRGRAGKVGKASLNRSTVAVTGSIAVVELQPSRRCIDTDLAIVGRAAAAIIIGLDPIVIPGAVVSLSV